MERLNRLSGILIVLIVVLLIIRGALSILVFTPRLASTDVTTVATTYMQCQQWALNGTARGIWAPDYKAFRNAQGSGAEFFNEAFMASNMEFEAPESVELNTAFEEEVQVVMSYRSLWQGREGAAPGVRTHAIYLARNQGSGWKIVGEQDILPTAATPAP